MSPITRNKRSRGPMARFKAGPEAAGSFSVVVIAAR
jgi:hypothetical protein